MEKLETIILISSFCCVFSQFSGIMQYIAWRMRKTFPGSTCTVTPKLRPFDCAKCLSFWMGLIVFAMQGEGLMAIFYASTCSVLSIYIVRYAK